jgi:hypothetical protein
MANSLSIPASVHGNMKIEVDVDTFGWWLRRRTDEIRLHTGGFRKNNVWRNLAQIVRFGVDLLLLGDHRYAIAAGLRSIEGSIGSSNQGFRCLPAWG